MINRKILLRAAILMLATSLLGTAMLLSGCAARVPTTATAPGRPGTPIENVLAYNASLADANLSVANAVIAAQQAGAVTVDAANRILTAQSIIADGDRQLTFLLQGLTTQLKTNPGAKLNAATVNALLARINASATGLVNSGDLGIKDAKTQQSVTGSLTAIIGFAKNVASTLAAAGLVQ